MGETRAILRYFRGRTKLLFLFKHRSADASTNHSSESQCLRSSQAWRFPTTFVLAKPVNTKSCEISSAIYEPAHAFTRTVLLFNQARFLESRCYWWFWQMRQSLQKYPFHPLYSMTTVSLYLYNTNYRSMIFQPFNFCLKNSKTWAKFWFWVLAKKEFLN